MNINMKISWSAPDNVRALMLTKEESLADLPKNVEIRLLEQVHDNHIITLPTTELSLKADGVYTQAPLTACVIKTADCLAILLCDKKGKEIAALHAGWKGLSKKIIFEGVKKFKTTPSRLIAWISPAICAQHYEVDQVVYDAFISQEKELKGFFHPNRAAHWRCDLRGIAKYHLNKAGVKAIFENPRCTFEDEKHLYSFRRDPQDPGRLLHLIWRE